MSQFHATIDKVLLDFVSEYKRNMLDISRDITIFGFKNATFEFME